MKWSSNYRLVLVYKDDPVQQKGLLSSARASESLTIKLHRELTNASPTPSEEPSLFPGLEPQFRYNERYTQAVSSNCFVWGWWRKPWEVHWELFNALQRAARGATKPVALLYNQYVRRLYKAAVHDVYFEPQLTSVVVPASWRHRCPGYYRDTAHLCGAFFSLAFEPPGLDAPPELEATVLEELFVDAASFEMEALVSPSIIPPPEGVKPACLSMIDTPPRRSGLRMTESTILVLRPTKQRQYLSDLLRKDHFDGGELTYALRGTAWLDILDVLSRASLPTWARLSQCPDAITELGRKARESNSRVTRLDLELVARACASTGMRDLLAIQNGNGEPRFAGLGEALRQWVTTSGEREAREAASDVFKSAWTAATYRFKLAPLPEKYFEYLPAMEAIASAVQHELGKKFYRDHLSHNVRAGLLSGSLTEHVGGQLDGGLNESVVAFFAGLLHDIALPVTTYPDIVGNLAQALGTVQGGDDAPPRVAGILDRQRLRRSLAYVALLSSIPNVSSSLQHELLAPWRSPEIALGHADTQLLFEELLCIGSEEHALISAAIVFDAAVRGASSDFDSGVRSVLSRMTGPSADCKGRELATILQSMALHDRKPAALYHGVSEPPTNTPKPLQWSAFRIPMVVAIADEFQEWGRTLASIEGLGAVDASVHLDHGSVRACIVLSDRPETFASVPFSLLESMLGKIRSVGSLMYDEGPTPHRFQVKTQAKRLCAFKLSYAAPGVAAKIMLKEGYEFMSMSSNDPQRTGEVQGAEDSELFRIVVNAIGNPGRDYVLLSGRRPLLDECIRIAKNSRQMEEITLDSLNVRFLCSDGSVINGDIESYRFGGIGHDSAPSTEYPTDGPIALLRVMVTDAKAVEPDPGARQPHMRPAPHFLDSDWRFTERTARVIVEYAKTQAAAAGGKVCYLGCPTLALWHAKHFPDDKGWLLLDKGHVALSNWLGTWIPRDQFKEFDVFTRLDDKLNSGFAFVIADPPWYEREYAAFWDRAQRLVVPNGVIGITYYPPILDQAKYLIFQKMMRSAYALYGATEIDYEVPEFEVISGLHSQFEHLESRVYRPGYMDFYQAPKESKTHVAPAVSGKRKKLLPEVEMLDEVHYMRCSKRVRDSRTFPVRVTVARHGLGHVTELPNSCLGWTTRNLVLSVSPNGVGKELSSLSELVKYVAERDADAGLQPSERLVVR
jgi:hypothetical protein